MAGRICSGNLTEPPVEKPNGATVACWRCSNAPLLPGRRSRWRWRWRWRGGVGWGDGVGGGVAGGRWCCGSRAELCVRSRTHTQDVNGLLVVAARAESLQARELGAVERRVAAWGAGRQPRLCRQLRRNPR
jgi:hypothetical protein